MKQVFTATESVELELLKNMLEQAGITCVLRNQQLSQALPAIPFAVELWVEKEDEFQKAQDLCQAWFSARPGATGSWTCVHCGQRLKRQFDSCWKCGTQRETPDPFNKEGKDDEDDENISRFVD